jgi:UDP:flavonoid glycosyltransferase YjiC (YdhE family)
MTTPFLLFVATPAEGHFFPLRAIAKELYSRGYNCSVLLTENFRSRVEEIGVNFIGHAGDADYVLSLDLEGFPEDGDPSKPIELSNFMLKKFFLNPVPAQHFDIQQVLKSFQDKDPERPVIIFTEPGFLGVLPMFAGAPGLRAPVINMGVVPLSLTGIDSVSFGGQGEIPDFTPESRKRIKASNTFIRDVFLKEPIALYHNIMKEMGANKKEPTFFFDDAYFMSDRVLQMCSPSAEYPRTDMPPHVSFVGSLPPGYRDAWVNPPAWWPEIRANKEKKRIVFVCQGTAFIDYTQLLIPTIEAFKDSSNTIVIAALGVKGTTLPADVEIPANCYVEDYVPYDEILPVADVFIMNSGYGGYQHGLQHGIPLVMAGEGADKPEVGARGEWAGVAVNLKKQSPTAEEIREAAEKALTDPKYKKRALELQAEARSYNPIELIVKVIPEVAAKMTVQ